LYFFFTNLQHSTHKKSVSYRTVIPFVFFLNQVDWDGLEKIYGYALSVGLDNDKGGTGSVPQCLSQPISMILKVRHFFFKVDYLILFDLILRPSSLHPFTLTLLMKSLSQRQPAIID